LEETLLQWISQYGYEGIFFLLLLGIVGLPIPDETLMTFSGYLIYKGQLSLVPTAIAAFLGSICGISISYIIGRTGGTLLVSKYGPWLHITQDKIDRVHKWLEHTGRWGLFFGYFVPGVRHITAIVAGTTRLQYPIFAAFAYTGGLFWCTSFITAGFFLGKQWRVIVTSLHRWMPIVLVVAGCGLVVYYLLRRRKAGK
jgi:membrane protein DedA with SNARE-associated domain